MKESKKEISKLPGLEIFTRSNDKKFGSWRMHVNLREIRLSRRTGDALGMEKCSKIMFMKFGDEWYISVIDDPEAYHATRETKSRSGYRICARYISRGLLTAFNMAANRQLELILKKSERYEFKSKPVYQLIKFEE